MIRPYPAKELDDILYACIEYKNAFPDNVFYSANISGRGNVPVSPGRVLYQKLKYISGLNLYLLEYLSHGLNNIEYFDLGPYARTFMNDGGFAKYYRDLENDKNNKGGNQMKTDIAEHGATQCDYVIITALEEDEMEKILPIFTRVGR